ncbi:12713_t:CDS:2, partial [Funneliformis geosporum]
RSADGSLPKTLGERVWPNTSTPLQTLIEYAISICQVLLNPNNKHIHITEKTVKKRLQINLQKIRNQEELGQSEEDENSEENVTIPEKTISEKSEIPEKNSLETSEESLEFSEKQTSKRKRAEKTIKNMLKGKHIRYS